MLRIVFLILGVLIFLTAHGALDHPPVPLEVEPDSFWVGIFLLAALSYLAFRVRVWGGHVSRFFQPQAIVLHAEHSPFHVFIQSVTAIIMWSLVALTIFIVSMEYTGRHEELVSLWDALSARMDRLISVLLH